MCQGLHLLGFPSVHKRRRRRVDMFLKFVATAIIGYPYFLYYDGVETTDSGITDNNQILKTPTRVAVL